MPWARVDANVRLPLDLAGVAQGAKAGSVLPKRLRGSGSTASRAHYPRQLSGGMKMRVSIARSLVTEPNLLLMDEPFGALDEFTRNRLDADLVRLWWERKLTIVFVTHSIYEAVFLSTRVAVMGARPGRIFKIMPIDEAASARRELPQLCALRRILPRLSGALTEASLAQLQR